MTSIRDRAKLYQQAAEETAKFGDLDVPLEKEWAVDTAAIDEEAIAKKAREYEQNVKILRADQDTPGLLAKFEAGADESILQVDDQVDTDSYHSNININTNTNTNAGDVASPKPSIAAKALEYEQNVQDLLADQDTPGMREKLQTERSKATSSFGTAGILSDGSASTRPSAIYSPRTQSGRDMEITSPKRIPLPMHDSLSSPAAEYAEYSQEADVYGDGDGIAAASEGFSSYHGVSSVRSGTGTRDDSFHSAGPQLSLSLSDDDFGSFTDLDSNSNSNSEEASKRTESVVQMEALKAGNEFTNDAMAVNDEEDLSPDSYLVRKRRGEMEMKMASEASEYPDKAPVLDTFIDGATPVVEEARVSSAQSLSESATTSASLSAPLSHASKRVSSYTLSSRSHSKSAVGVDIDIDDIDSIDIDIDIDIAAEEGLLDIGSDARPDRGDRGERTTRDRRAHRPGGGRRRIVAPPRRDTGRPSGPRPRARLPPEVENTTNTNSTNTNNEGGVVIDPVDVVDDLSYDLDLDEDEGVRSGWARPQNDRLPKAKVVIARRRSSSGSGVQGVQNSRSASGTTASTLSGVSLPSYHRTNHMNDGPATAPAQPGRRLVKQYKDRNELLAGRVSHVKMGGGGASGRVNLEREERLRRHNAGVARRSSLVAGTLDRVSMAADPFIDFMDNRGGIAPGPKKPKGGLRKMMRKLFRRGRRNRDLLKTA